MGYVIHHDQLGGYIEKRDGMNIGHRDPRKATIFDTMEQATNARPGHHRDMGGKGFSGTVCSYKTARNAFDAAEARKDRWWS